MACCCSRIQKDPRRKTYRESIRSFRCKSSCTTSSLSPSHRGVISREAAYELVSRCEAKACFRSSCDCDCATSSFASASLGSSPTPNPSLLSRFVSSDNIGLVIQCRTMAARKAERHDEDQQLRDSQGANSIPSTLQVRKQSHVGSPLNIMSDTLTAISRSKVIAVPMDERRATFLNGRSSPPPLRCTNKRGSRKRMVSQRLAAASIDNMGIIVYLFIPMMQMFVSRTVAMRLTFLSEKSTPWQKASTHYLMAAIVTAV